MKDLNFRDPLSIWKMLRGPFWQYKWFSVECYAIPFVSTSISTRALRMLHICYAPSLKCNYKTSPSYNLLVLEERIPHLNQGALVNRGLFNHSQGQGILLLLCSCWQTRVRLWHDDDKRVSGDLLHNDGCNVSCVMVTSCGPRCPCWPIVIMMMTIWSRKF